MIPKLKQFTASMVFFMFLILFSEHKRNLLVLIDRSNYSGTVDYYSNCLCIIFKMSYLYEIFITSNSRNDNYKSHKAIFIKVLICFQDDVMSSNTADFIIQYNFYLIIWLLYEEYFTQKERICLKF